MTSSNVDKTSVNEGISNGRIFLRVEGKVQDIKDKSSLILNESGIDDFKNDNLVVYVEGSELARKWVSRLCTRELRVNIISCETGKEGLENIKEIVAKGKIPDAVILGSLVNLEIYNKELVDEIRGFKGCENLSIGVFTAISFIKEELQNRKELDFILSKPLDLSLLRELFLRILCKND